MKTKYTFWELISEYCIEIPKIQRDYAQGRKDKDIEKIANKFLKDLHSTIINEEQLNLDFVYGKVEKVSNDKKNILVPLDGQQRLTTLFLIHWYLALKEDKLNHIVKSTLLDFTYETRISSQDFCEKLVEENIDYSSITSKISDSIIDSKWYFLSWERDPTVSSMLNMIDKIHNIFMTNDDIFDKLISNEIITFQFLPLEEFKLTDELYIKMNARGLPLTEFENFKAYFSGYLKTIENKSKLDNQWLDIFWEMEKNEKGEIATKKVDEKFFEFFKNITLNFYTETKEIDRSFIDNYDLFEIYNSVYINETYVNNIVEILDALNEYNDEDNIFNNFISSNVNYWERLRFYSLSHFFIKYGKITDSNNPIFKRWLRVTNNLTNNTLIQSADNYQDAIHSIKKLSEHIEDIYSYISSSADTIEYFLGIQRKEESLKAKLIIEDIEWEKSFVEIEKHPYFDGQIGFALEYSKGSNENYNKKLFKNYSKELSKLFSNEFKENYHFIFQRALLAKGDYLVDAGRNKTFCVFDEALRTKMDNWRKVFNDVNKTLYLKDLLEDIDSNNIKDSLLKITENYNISDWQKFIIENHSNISYCNNRQVRFDSDKVYILSKTQMNGMHKELHSWDLYERKYKNKYFVPFSRTGYDESKSSDEPCIVIGNFEYDNSKYDFTIEYIENDKFYLKFYRKISEYNYWYYSSNIPDNLSEILKTNGFDGNKILLTEDELEPRIKDICEGLSKSKE